MLGEYVKASYFESIHNCQKFGCISDFLRSRHRLLASPSIVLGLHYMRPYKFPIFHSSRRYLLIFRHIGALSGIRKLPILREYLSSSHSMNILFTCAQIHSNSIYGRSKTTSSAFCPSQFAVVKTLANHLSLRRTYSTSWYLLQRVCGQYQTGSQDQTVRHQKVSQRGEPIMSLFSQGLLIFIFLIMCIYSFEYKRKLTKAPGFEFLPTFLFEPPLSLLT